MIFSEIELMKIIQKFNFSKQMKFISSPFNTSGFIILIISLYIYNILNNNDIKLLVIITILAIIIKVILVFEIAILKIFEVIHFKRNYR